MTTHWKSYEEVAAYLLDQNAHEFGLERVEGKQSVPGLRSGTPWEIDAKGIRDADGAFVIIECRRRTTSRQNQELMGGLAYRIIDTGASGGIIVSPLGIQKGAGKIAAAERILNVQLDAYCTPTEFAMRFLNRLMVGLEFRAVADVSCEAEVQRVCKICGRPFMLVETENTCPECRGGPQGPKERQT